MEEGDLFETQMDTEVEASKERGALETFHSLDEVSQMVGYALAWLHEPISMTALTNRLANAGVSGRGGKRITNHQLKQSLQVLNRCGVAQLRKGGGYHIDWIVSHYLVAEAYENPELLAVLRGLPLNDYRGYTSFSSSYYRYHDWETGELHAVRDLRERFYEGDAGKLGELLREIGEIRREWIVPWEFVLHPFQGKKLRALEPDLFRLVADWCVLAVTERLFPTGELLALMVERAVIPSDWQRVGALALFRADWETAERAEMALRAWESPMAEVMSLEILGGAAFLSGDDESAISAFEKSMALWRKATRKRRCCPHDLFGIWFVAALLRRGRAEDLVAAGGYARTGAGMFGARQYCFNTLQDLSEVVAGQDKARLRVELQRVAPQWLNNPEPGLYDLLFYILTFLQLRGTLKRADCGAVLEHLRERAESGGAHWLAAEASGLRDAWLGNPSVAQKKQTEAHLARLGPKARPLATSFRVPERWEHTVRALESLSEELGRKGKKKSAAKKKAAAQKQLFWCLTAGKLYWSLVPYERTISVRGKVSNGRAVSLKRLKERHAEMEHLTAQDRKLAMHVRRYSSWGRQLGHALDSPRALLDLVGHPLLYSDHDGTQPLELVKVSPRLAVSETKKGTVKLELTPKADYKKAEPELLVESPTRYLVLDRSKIHVRLAELLGGGDVEIPAEAKERVVKALGGLADQLAIESDEDTLGEVGIERVAAACQPVLRLFPHGEGLHARLIIRPLEGAELSCDPGEGKAMVFARQAGKQVQARRDLEAERVAATGILEACPTFAEYADRQGERWSAMLDEPVACLNLLEEIHHLATEAMVVEWPEGQPYRLHSVADTAQFELSLGGSKEWLTASGKLPLDDDLVLTMRQLLELTAASAETPGFVRLGDGQFLALTKAFRRHLEDLRAYSQPGKGEQLRIHPLAALALDELTSHPGVKTGAAWKKQLARIRKVEEKPAPHPPSTLQAELRPYQLDGYRWLRRLADWGMGACLADDMGLGKTVQALALLLDRAPEGPALVVAPTSVAGNWLEETIRFAPTLQPIIFGRQGEDRGAILREAGPFDLVITSYGLLQSEAEAFAGRSWHTVILDEAQAIKNRATKRSRAAMKLEAGFRLITTGTPVENRLGELHNLFSFLNPGLLGSWEKFRKTFADPIERQEDGEARERLRRLVRPFILRRLKSEVLRELPSRTEIALNVELAPEEAAFYEALRQKAVDDLNRSTEEDGKPGQAAIRILAELTRLRRACCHPRLIDPKTPLGSAKLRVFAETLEEILAGNHKVLVFSQFVDHLHLIREHLDKERISYQYLDGSTPAAMRQEAVRDFQSGKGEVFLISLKAGGFGLNLTAADYVIHMDPWWNPAAEDQASDRAHRIGQTRPVTIYRLITSGTIEEKIVDLHHRKRELADSILEGTDSAGRLTPDELLELLRGDE